MKADIKVLKTNELKSLVCVLVGTRPGIIKMSPIIRALIHNKSPFIIIHAGQHYDDSMSGNIYNDLNIPQPHYFLKDVKNYKTHATQTAAMMVGIEEILFTEKPILTLVCADANFNFAGAISARKLNIFVGHVESGLRSHDWSMPEEHNRVMIDHISDFLFCPTKESKDNLIKECVKGKIIITGNTIVDSLLYGKKISENKSDILRKLKIQKNKYFVLTIHREENVDILAILSQLYNIVIKILDDFNIPIIFPIHPRTKKRLKEFNLFNKFININKLIITEPFGYIDFIKLLSNSSIVLTDSGGIQEEASILHTPCITLRKSTERPETVRAGLNIVTDINIDKIIKGITKHLSNNHRWINLYGDGRAAYKMLNSVSYLLKV